MSRFHQNIHLSACVGLLGALLLSPANATDPVISPGIVTMSATINDYSGSTSSTSGQRHDVVVWVTKEDGTFIKTLWKQGPADFANVDWTDHFVIYNTARNGSTAIDGFTGATAQSYAAPNNPLFVTWNCRDAGNNLMEDGNYKFWIQYAESKTITGVGPEQGPVANGLTWTKGPASQSITPANEGTYGSPANGNNFTNLAINWIYATVPPTLTSSAPHSSGSQGTPYTHTLTATGSDPITYSVSTGALPTGLTLTPGGGISGTPIVAGTFTGTITAANGVLPNAAQPFSITISEAIVFTSAAPPANGNLVTAYNHNCTVIGTGPVTFALGSGALPGGLTLSTAGVISGTPNQLGTFSGNIIAHNGIATDVSQAFAITVSQATMGTVTLTGTLADYSGGSGVATSHYAVVWVTDAAGKFIKTLWKQGPAFTSKEWTDHTLAYTTARASNTMVDGFTSATAADYTTPVNNPLFVTWNCQDANGHLVDDGNYKFFIQYSENQSGVQGPISSGLTWTKGLQSSRIDPPAEGTQGSPVGGFNFSGLSIDWDSSEVSASELVVEEPQGSPLVDGSAVKDCGSLLVGTSGDVFTFVLRNTGNVDLTDLAITKDGSNASDFEVTSPLLTTVMPTAATTFTVVFTPSAAGARSAAIHITSNDSDDSPFDIHLTGTGTLPPAPEIVVMEPNRSSLVDGKTRKIFGTIKIGSERNMRIKEFTIKNIGTSDLTGLRIKTSGTDQGDFRISRLNKTTLPPKAATTFQVTFKPGIVGSHFANIHIISNDEDESPFDIKLVGEAVK